MLAQSVEVETRSTIQDAITIEIPYYESDRGLGEYLLFHYGTEEQIIPPFACASMLAGALHYPVRCVQELVDRDELPSAARALDLGCAVGRSSFELARYCTEVVGIDYSHRFILSAKEMRDRGSVQGDITVEGDEVEPLRFALPPEIERKRVRFLQGDAQKLPPDLGQFDIVLLANLIDRLPRPLDCLRQLPVLMRSGGQLIITSPYTWLEAYTPRENWLCNRSGDKSERAEISKQQPCATLLGLQRALEPPFSLERTADLPFLIREHQRKYQWSVAQASIWKRL